MSNTPSYQQLLSVVENIGTLTFHETSQICMMLNGHKWQNVKYIDLADEIVDLGMHPSGIWYNTCAKECCRCGMKVISFIPQEKTDGLQATGMAVTMDVSEWV